MKPEELADELQTYFDAPGLGFDKAIAGAALEIFMHRHGSEILSSLRRVAKLEAALEKIAHGPVGTLDPLGDGGTYCLTGNEWLTFRDIARQALTALNDKDEYR